MIDIIEKMKTEMLRRKYSIRTITAYCDVVNKFLGKLKKDDLRKITKADIKDYLNTLQNKAGNTINVHLCALKFMMEEILHKNCYVHIKYSKTPKKAAGWLTKEEIQRLFDAIENSRHKLMIKLLYSAGLRVSELVNLKVCDLDFDKKIGMVRKGKGNKDRPFIIAEKIKGELIDFIRLNDIGYNSYLFKGDKYYKGNFHISQRTIQEILRQAGKKAGIKKNVHPHMLRHSFGEHMKENGYDSLVIQALLGHKDLSTTMRYIHSVPVINAKSPIDSLIKKELTML